MCGDNFHSMECSTTSHLPSTTMQRMQRPACQSCVLVIQIQRNTIWLCWEALLCENDAKCVATIFIQWSALRPATFRRQRCNACNGLHVNHAFWLSRFNATRFGSAGRHFCAKMMRNVWRQFSFNGVLYDQPPSVDNDATHATACMSIMRSGYPDSTQHDLALLGGTFV